MSRYFVGIDSGSWNTKVVLIDESMALRGSAVVRSGADLPGAANEALEYALDRARLTRSDVSSAWATGFGRHPLARHLDIVVDTRTELDTHGRGVHHHVAGALTIIDIGGQDAKVIKLDRDGRRVDHKMNRKCAAGTGSFLEEIALRLGVATAELDHLAARFQSEIALGSFCTVFASTELLSAIREGKRPADLARAAYKSVVQRVLDMTEITGQVVATGGVAAHHPMVIELLAKSLNAEVVVPPHAQEMGAFGAALAAREAFLAAESMTESS